MVEASSTQEPREANIASVKASEVSKTVSLMKAAAKGDVDGVRHLLDSGADHLYQVAQLQGIVDCLDCCFKIRFPT